MRSISGPDRSSNPDKASEAMTTRRSRSLAPKAVARGQLG